MVQEKIIPNHMDIYWHDYADKTETVPITEASMIEKSTLVGRVGLMLLACGTGAWRVRSSMNTVAKCLGLTCHANIGLMSIDYSCFDGNRSFSHSLSLNNTGVNTLKLDRLERFVKKFPQEGIQMTAEQLHSRLDEINQSGNLYTPVLLGLASALACGAFTFLLGGGIIEMICAFIGAGIGNYLRCRLLQRHYTLFLCIVSSVALACLAYTAALRAAESLFAVPVQHEAGYICAMLFIIPGFPFITSGIDLAKLDMRSGLERLAYAVMIIVVATVTAWILAVILKLEPEDFVALSLGPALLFGLRLIASFCGVFGFSIMFNSPVPLAATAALIGAVANTLRLELAELDAFPPAAAAFIGSLTAGLLASLLTKRLGYPRIAITVPSIVIMVPGMYLYRGVYNLGEMSLTPSASWLASALLIILALPLGLIFARIITDRSFRHCT
ncbi:threonine/serine exporter family protein [Lachnospiraceae bacterium KGMB03038]|nr:threonine/serine exporter family protein [Lachnospiraceae bacterium KGMB03038]